MQNSGGTAITFAHLDTTIVLERSIAEMKIYDGGSAQIDLSRPRA
jgi:F0F1-type ATP synthase beta subunit